MIAKANEFVLTREFSAPRQLVFDVWTNPEHVCQWWGPDQFTCPVCEIDLRPGGAYRFVMRAPDGTDYPVKGTILDVAPPERLVMSEDCSGHPDEWFDAIMPDRDKNNKNPLGDITNMITFEELGPRKTRVTIHTIFETAAIRDAMTKMGMSEGWNQSLDKMDTLLAKLQG